MTETAAAPTAATRPRAFRISVAQKSDTGLVRSENQDFFILSSPDEDSVGKGRLMVVADGMGGHRGGATASRLAGNTIKESYLGNGDHDPTASLKTALMEANRKIFTEAQANPDVRGMGTTTSALVLHDGQAFIAHVGDSRIYLVRDHAIRQLTDDHSLVASMVREGLLTSKEAEVHPRRNVLQRSMGVGETVEIDLLSPLDLQPGDTFILCSDGLHGLVKEQEMLEVAQLSLQAAVDEFVRRALDRGAPDNVTVVMARVEDVNAPQTEMPAAPPPVSAQDIPTEKIPAMTGSRTSPLPRILLGTAILAALASIVLYLLGYRFDPDFFRHLSR